YHFPSPECGWKGLQLQPDLPPLVSRLDLIEDCFCQFFHIDIGLFEGLPAKTGERQETIDELAETAGIGTDDIQQSFTFVIQFVGVLFHEDAREPVDSSQRAAYIIPNGI